MITLIVRYTGDLKRLQEELGFEAEELLGGYAIVHIEEEAAPLLLFEEEILWTEVPARVYTEVVTGKRVSCITSFQTRRPTLTGAGVLVAIIDSGIDYTHSDFRNEDGTTRIAALWDQTAQGQGEPPAGYRDGVLYTKEQIDRALAGEQAVSGGSLVPEQDLSGHGTHVAGIAAGNGRASGGRYRGVAYESTLLVVKLGGTQADPFPQTTNLMTAVDFCVRYAAEAGLPIGINLSFGNSEGAHDGQSLLETYLNEVSLYGRVCICIGTGNDANEGRHVGGILVETEKQILLNVGGGERRLSMGLWMNSLDTVAISLEDPSGTEQRLPENLQGTGTAVKGYPVAGGTVLPFGTTVAEVFVGEATPYRGLREISITLRGEEEAIEAGTWRIRLQPERILDGVYDIWLARGTQNTLTRFLQPTPERTLTIPSTAERPIAVAAYDARTSSTAVFSGRGYPRAESGVKPDLAAPGVDIISCAPGGGYTTKSGTSMATPFVTGAAALLMQWGIVQGNDPYLYGERLKTVLLKSARELPGLTEYPNTYVGWGTLCLSLEEEF
ncbi:MAG: S8 family serine peptidase [Lachnospiraceae bacterium]|nr:S8 family serine peptidase [Lachnospiraceae bacterium]